MSGRLDVESAPAGMDHGQGRTNGYTVHGPTTGQDVPHHTQPQSTRPSTTPTLHNDRSFTSRAVKNHLIAASGEFLGTLLFLWLAFAGVQTAGMNSQGNQVDPQRLLYMSLSFGMSLLIVVWAFFRISGGLFNPAVTLGLVIAGQLNWIRALVLLPFQLLGGICAAALVRAMFPGPMSLFQTRLSPETSVTRGIFIEMFLTAVLVFIVLMLAAEKHYGTFLAPVGIGLTLFICELAGIYFTGGSLNPARSFGPDVAAASFVGYHYIYWFGPIMGSLLASGYYRLVKSFNYEEVNPGQDAMSEREAKRAS